MNLYLWIAVGAFVVVGITLVTLWLTGVLGGNATSATSTDPFLITNAALNAVREDAEFCPDPSTYASSQQSGLSTGPLAATGNVLLAGRTLYNVNHGGALELITANLYTSDIRPLGTAVTETLVATSNAASVGMYWAANGEPLWSQGALDSRIPGGPLCFVGSKLVAQYVHASDAANAVVHVFTSDGTLLSNLDVQGRALASVPGNAAVLYATDDTGVHEYRDFVLYDSYVDPTASKIALSRSQLVYATPTRVVSRETVDDVFNVSLFQTHVGSKIDGPVDVHYDHRVCVLDQQSGQANIKHLSSQNGQLLGPDDAIDLRFATRYNGFESILYASNTDTVFTFTAACQ